MILLPVTVSCEKCRTTYRIDDSKIPPQGVKAKCPKCNHSFILQKPAAEPAAPANPLGGDAFGGPPVDPFSSTEDPFGGAAADPFGGGADSFGDAGDPFASAAPAAPAAPAPASASAPASAPAPADTGGGFGGDPFGDDPFGGDTSGASGGDSLFAGDKTEFRIKKLNGETHGPYDMFTLKQMIYEQELEGTEQIETNAGVFEPIMNNTELAEIFRLLGKQSAGSGDFDTLDEAAAGTSGPTAGEPGTSPDGGEPATFDLDAGGGAQASMLIGIEKAWEVLKRPATIIVLVIVVVVAGGAVGIYSQWEAVSSMLGLSQAKEARAARARAEPHMFSGSRKDLQAAATALDEALSLGKDAWTSARVAELQARLWMLEPERLDAKSRAAAEIALAEQDADDSHVKPALHRAKAQLALAQGDPKVAATELAALEAADASEPMLPFLKGELALFNGDAVAAEAAFKQALTATITVGGESQQVGQAVAILGLARVESLRGDWTKARLAGEKALKADAGLGGAKVIIAYAVTQGEDAEAVEAGRLDLVHHASNVELFTADRAKAHYFLGVIAEDAGQTEPALYRYKRALAASPTDAEALAASRRLFKKRFPNRDAKAWLAAISTVRGSSAMDLVQRGEVAIEQNKPGAAVVFLEKARNRDLSSARIHLALGRTYMFDETNYPLAVQNLERAIAIDKNFADAIVARARLHGLQKEYEKAAQRAKSALQLDPTHVRGRLEAGRASLALGKEKVAIGHLKIALQFNPDLADAWLNLGLAHIVTGAANEAVRPLQRAVKLAPKDPDTHLALGQAYEALSELGKAAEAYNAALKLDPKNLDLQARVGILFVKAGNYVAGRKTLDSVAEVKGDDQEVHFFLAQAYELTGEFTAAELHYRRVTSLAPKNHLAYHRLGVITYKQGNYTDARDYFEAALKVKPDYYEANEQLADLYAENAEYDKALTELKSVEGQARKLPKAKRDAVQKRVWLVAAGIWRTRGSNRDPIKARSYYRKVLRVDRRSADALYGLGLLDTDGNPKAAVQRFVQAIRVDPAFAPPYRDLGYLYKQFNNCRGAVANFKKYMAKAEGARDLPSVQDEISLLEEECG